MKKLSYLAAIVVIVLCCFGGAAIKEKYQSWTEKKIAEEKEAAKKDQPLKQKSDIYYENLGVGASATFDNGLTVTLNNYESGSSEDLLDKLTDACVRDHGYEKGDSNYDVNYEINYKVLSKYFDFDTYTKINVTYENEGEYQIAYDSGNWTGQDSDIHGHEEIEVTSLGYLDDCLEYGTLYTGDKVTGDVYIEGTLAIAFYTGKSGLDSNRANWRLK